MQDDPVKLTTETLQQVKESFEKLKVPVQTSLSTIIVNEEFLKELESLGYVTTDGFGSYLNQKGITAWTNSIQKENVVTTHKFDLSTSKKQVKEFELALRDVVDSHSDSEYLSIKVARELLLAKAEIDTNSRSWSGLFAGSIMFYFDVAIFSFWFVAAVAFGAGALAVCVQSVIAMIVLRGLWFLLRRAMRQHGVIYD